MEKCHIFNHFLPLYSTTIYIFPFSIFFKQNNMSAFGSAGVSSGVATTSTGDALPQCQVIVLSMAFVRKM
jgi:hypothetical protein